MCTSFLTSPVPPKQFKMESDENSYPLPPVTPSLVIVNNLAVELPVAVRIRYFEELLQRSPFMKIHKSHYKRLLDNLKKNLLDVHHQRIFDYALKSHNALSITGTEHLFSLCFVNVASSLKLLAEHLVPNIRITDFSQLPAKNLVELMNSLLCRLDQLPRKSFTTESLDRILSAWAKLLDLDPIEPYQTVFDILSSIDDVSKWCALLTTKGELRKRFLVALERAPHFVPWLTQCIIRWINEPTLPTSKQQVDGNKSRSTEFSTFYSAYHVFVNIFSFEEANSLFPIKIQTDRVISLADVVSEIIMFLGTHQFTGDIPVKLLNHLSLSLCEILKNRSACNSSTLDLILGQTDAWKDSGIILVSSLLHTEGSVLYTYLQSRCPIASLLKVPNYDSNFVDIINRNTSSIINTKSSSINHCNSFINLCNLLRFYHIKNEAIIESARLLNNISYCWNKKRLMGSNPNAQVIGQMAVLSYLSWTLSVPSLSVKVTQMESFRSMLPSLIKSNQFHNRKWRELIFFSSMIDDPSIRKSIKNMIRSCIKKLSDCSDQSDAGDHLCTVFAAGHQLSGIQNLFKFEDDEELDFEDIEFSGLADFLAKGLKVGSVHYPVHCITMEIIRTLSFNMDSALFLHETLNIVDRMTEFDEDSRTDLGTIIDESTSLRNEILKRYEINRTDIKRRPLLTLPALPIDSCMSEFMLCSSDDLREIENNDEMLWQILKLIYKSDEEHPAEVDDSPPPPIYLTVEETHGIELISRISEYYEVTKPESAELTKLYEITKAKKSLDAEYSSNFNWIFAVTFMSCRGNLQVIQKCLRLISLLKPSSLLGLTTESEQLWDNFEKIMLKELPELYKKLKDSGVPWWIVFRQWFRQFFIGVLSWSEVILRFHLLILTPPEFGQYYLISVLKHAENFILRMNDEEFVFNILREETFSGYRLTDYIKFMNELYGKYHSEFKMTDVM